MSDETISSLPRGVQWDKKASQGLKPASLATLNAWAKAQAYLKNKDNGESKATTLARRECR